MLEIKFNLIKKDAVKVCKRQNEININIVLIKVTSSKAAPDDNCIAKNKKKTKNRMERRRNKDNS